MHLVLARRFVFSFKIIRGILKVQFKVTIYQEIQKSSRDPTEMRAKARRPCSLCDVCLKNSGKNTSQISSWYRDGHRSVSSSKRGSPATVDRHPWASFRRLLCLFSATLESPASLCGRFCGRIFSAIKRPGITGGLRLQDHNPQRTCPLWNP